MFSSLGCCQVIYVTCFYIYVLWQSIGNTHLDSNALTKVCKNRAQHTVNIKEFSVLIFHRCFTCTLNYTFHCVVSVMWGNVRKLKG